MPWNDQGKFNRRKNMKKGVLLAVLMSFFALQLPALAAQSQEEQLKAKKEELNGTEWNVNVTSAADKTKSHPDTLKFQDGRFESAKLKADGFNSTNYTLTLQEGGPTVFETMQSHENGAVVFWRGEWDGESMRGLLSKQKDGKSEDSYFSSTTKQDIAKSSVVETPKEEVPAVEPETEPADETAAPVEEKPAPAKEEPKKKKGWF
jgi:hypothetical protein